MNTGWDGPSGADGCGSLRDLLRQQLCAAQRSDWPEFARLAAAVAGALVRPAGPCDRAAMAEAAHLQLRLERLLRGRAQGAQDRMRRVAAATAYSKAVRTD